MFVLLKSSSGIFTFILLYKNLRESFHMISKDNFMFLLNKKFLAPFIIHYAVKKLTL